MAYTEGALHLRAGAPGELMYTYDAGSDSMFTVATAGYFNNTDDSLNLVAEDLIFCDCTDGNMWLRVASISSGSVTTNWCGGDLPTLTPATGTSDALGGGFTTAGYAEYGTSLNGTATRFVLPTPYKGCVIHVQKVDAGTQEAEFDAGGSGATSITYDGSNRRILLRNEGEGFRVRATSTTRWRIEYLNHHASAVSEDASVMMPGT